ncbi:hypothetical protein OAS47_04675 [Pelagibacteraceae bacterium]|nr:hypothetical protein [Pelagibacteraceae bacterium]
MNIYDCLMYFDEDMILDLRFHVLNKFIKKFVVCESIYNHNGTKKKLNFNINNFKKFKDKIDYIILEDLPKNIESISPNDNEIEKNSKILTNALKRENYQRNGLLHGVFKADNEDLIIISDADEIPNLENFKIKNKLSFFIQKIFFYKFNLEQSEFTWIGSKACKKKHMIDPQWLRNIKGKSYPLWRIDTLFSKKKYFNINYVNNGGWHFTNIKSPEDLYLKHSNYLHHLEFEKSGIDIDEMKKIIEEKRVLYNLNTDKKENKWNSSIALNKAKDNVLPQYLIQNKNKYKEWLA